MQWSTDLDKAGYAMRYWQCRLFDITHGMISASMERPRARVGISDQDAGVAQTSAELQKKLQEAKAEFNARKRDHKDRREKMLHHRLKEAQAAAEEDDDNRAGQKTVKAIEAIIRAEQCKEAYEKIRFTT